MSDLIAAEQKEIVMYGDAVTAVRADDGEIYVTLAHMCDALGMQVQAQSKRIQRHAVLREGIGWVSIMDTQGDTPDQRRRVQALRADLVPLWLTGIQAARVSDDVRPKLEQLQRNAARLLWQAFQSGELTGDVDLDALLEQDTDAVQAYKMLTALAKMARQQVILESRVQSIEARLEDVEAALLPGEAVLTQDEASQIAQAVKGIALIWSKRTGRNEYGAVYGRLYDQFSVTGYKNLPRSKFREALDWLAVWREELKKPPF